MIPAPLLGSDTVCDSNSCYTFMQDNITWSKAYRTCAHRGQSLIDITSGIPEILRKVTDFGTVPSGPTHKSMFCPPVSFWAHTKQSGKKSYHKGLVYSTSPTVLLHHIWYCFNIFSLVPFFLDIFISDLNLILHLI
jgi:hypothetical protein